MLFSFLKYLAKSNASSLINVSTDGDHPHLARASLFARVRPPCFHLARVLSGTRGGCINMHLNFGENKDLILCLGDPTISIYAALQPLVHKSPTLNIACAIF